MIKLWKSMYRKHEEEYETQVQENINWLLENIKVQLPKEEIISDVFKDIRNSPLLNKLLDAPSVDAAYDLENYAIRLITSTTDAIKNVKRVKQLANEREAKLASEHFIDRFYATLFLGEEDAKYILEFYLKNKQNWAMNDLKNLMKGYVLLRIAHQYLDALANQPKDSKDPLQREFLQQISSSEAIMEMLSYLLANTPSQQTNDANQSLPKEVHRKS